MLRQITQCLTSVVRLTVSRVGGRICRHVVMRTTSAGIGRWRSSRVRRSMAASSWVRWRSARVARSTVGARIGGWSAWGTGVVVGIVRRLFRVRVSILALRLAFCTFAFAKTETTTALGLALHDVMRLVQLVVDLQLFGTIVTVFARLGHLRKGRDIVQLANDVENEEFAGHQKDE